MSEFCVEKVITSDEKNEWSDRLEEVEPKGP